jgi:hypothetical protein
MTEYHEQCAVFAWAALMEGQYPELRLLHASLNGAALAGGGRSWAILERAGAKKGVPDMLLPVARQGYHGLFIELKHGKNRASAEQLLWIAELERQGYLAVVCREAEGAIAELKEYLGTGLSSERMGENGNS